jgi:hypothetical protein
MPTTHNPWRDLTTPSQANVLCTRRVDVACSWDFFWGCNSHGDLLFLLRHDGPPLPHEKLPRLRGIAFSDDLEPDGSECVLVARLERPENRDIFAQLCRDIVNVAGAARDSSEALMLTLRRTWRWHHLLRGGNDGLLSGEQQKGLIGELFFLADVLGPAIGIAAAIRAWRGPYGGSQDFALASCAIEVKSRRAAGPMSVRISSAEQLEALEGSRLFLYVINVDEVDGGNGACLDAFVTRTMERAEREAPEALADLEAAFVAAGYEGGEKYRGIDWRVGDAVVCEVVDGFPMIAASSLAVGVERVNYTLDLNACARFAVPIDVVLNEVCGGA